MYIYKLTDNSGVYIGATKQYPNFHETTYVRQYNKIVNPKLTILDEDVSNNDVHLRMFDEALDTINDSSSYNLLNGRFRVESIMKYLGCHFIIEIVNKLDNKVYLKSCYDPVDKLYRIFNNGRGMKELVDDIKNIGKNYFEVNVRSTFDNPYRELLRIYKEYDNEGYVFYNESQYKELVSAENATS